ncbi:MAG: hypothetical protein JNM72_11185 [Deltaproteobacteria bacterium]|nr:hypothetical protein [Deltaproteobacteria bacterium]
MSKRVLVYSIYGRWATHTHLEGAWMHSLRNQGAEVRLISCDGAFSVCDVHRCNINPRHSLSCQVCQTETNQIMSDLRIDWEGIGHYMDRALRAVAKAHVDAIPDEELFKTTWDGQPVGEWARSSSFYHFRYYEPDWTNPAFVENTRKCVISTILAHEANKVLFDEFQPDVLILMNGRFYMHRAAIELAKQRGVRFITHERGRQDGNYRVIDGALVHDLSDYRKLWHLWKDIPLSADELHRVHHLFELRKLGKNINWVPFSPPPSDEGKVRTALRLDHRRIVTCFTSSDDELATMPEWSEGAFPRSLDWIPATVALARRRPDLMWVIRAHPNLGRLGGNLAALRQLEELAKDLPENCRIVRPNDDVSSYTLADITDVIVVYCSTMGMETGVAGKPVVTVAKGWYGEAGWAAFCRRPEDYERCVDEAFERGPQREVARHALRHAYLRFETMNFHLGLIVRKQDGRPAEIEVHIPRYVKGPLRNPLALLNALVLEGKPHHRQVTDEERARTTQDEETFLLNRLPQLCPESAPLLAAIAEADGHLARRDVQTALRTLMAAAQKEPRFVRTWLKLAEAFLKAGSKEGARDAWEKATKIDPTCREARAALLEHAMMARARPLVERHLEQLTNYLPTDELIPKVREWLAKNAAPQAALR